MLLKHFSAILFAYFSMKSEKHAVDRSIRSEEFYVRAYHGTIPLWIGRETRIIHRGSNKHRRLSVRFTLSDWERSE